MHHLQGNTIPTGHVQNPLSDVSWRNSYVRYLKQDLNIICIEMWASLQNFSYFCYKFAHKGRIPLSDFYKIMRGGGSPRWATLHQNFSIMALEMWTEVRQNCQNTDFFINQPIRGRSS